MNLSLVVSCLFFKRSHTYKDQSSQAQPKYLLYIKMKEKKRSTLFNVSVGVERQIWGASQTSVKIVEEDSFEDSKEFDQIEEKVIGEGRTTWEKLSKSSKSGKKSNKRSEIVTIQNDGK